MKKIILFFTGIVPYMVCAQNITGRVIEMHRQTPLAGATISAPGLQPVVTGENGEFAIPCSDSVLLTISNKGYETSVQKIACNTRIDIPLMVSGKDLDEVEITATSDKSKSPLSQPSSIVRLTNTELKRGNGLFLDDAINTNVPGVMMVKRTQSGGQQFNIRGYGNGMGSRGISNNFDGQGLKMYLNGIPITDAEGVTVMDDIDYASISNVEVLKGPAGTLYGLAIAGVVNLQTEHAEKGQVSVGQDVLAGSYGLLRSTTRLSIGGENSSLLVNYGRQQFNGFMPHTKSNKDFVNLTGDFRIGRKQTITAYMGYANSYDERNGELTRQQYDTLDYSGNPAYVKNNAHSAVRSFRAGLGHTWQLNRHVSNTTSLFGSAQSIDNSSAGGWTDKYPVNYGFRSVFDKRFSLNESVTLSGITGIEMQSMYAQTTGYGMSADSTNLGGYNIITSTRSNQVSNNFTYSYFTQWTLSLPYQLSITAGAGISNMFIILTDRMFAPANNHPGNQKSRTYTANYNNLVSPQFAVNKKISSVASVYASYSTGYKAPVGSNVLISTTGEVNKNLVPEKGTQIEVGTKGSFLENHLYYTLAIFNARFENKFTTVAVPNPQKTATLYTYLVNAGSLDNKGVELLLKYRLIDSRTGFVTLLQPFANLTYSDFKYGNFQFGKVGKNKAGKDSAIVEDYSGKTVAGVAPLVYNIGFDISTRPGLYGNVNYNFRDAMYYTSDGLNKTSPFSLLNAKIGFRKSIARFDIDVYGGANNITGTQYYNMVFVNQLPDAYIPGPNEINFFGGVNLRFRFNQ
jgi:iron complex outermembrane receptor protein